MKKLKLKFWYWFFYFGTCLYDLGDWMSSKGLDKLDELDRNNPGLVKQPR